MSKIIEGLGGSMFVHNAVSYDYCIVPALMSLLEFCEEVIILDAQSDDGTKELLRGISEKESRLKYYDNAVWECAKDYNRLAILANQARNLLTTEWHFMLQADEVLHERSYKFIQKAIMRSPGNDPWTEAFRVRRINVYGNFNLRLKYDSNRKPCGDNIVRLARKKVPATGDAESLHHDHGNPSYINYITIFHYGYMRKPDELLKKGIDMTTWFGHGTSQKLVEMRDGAGWNPYGIIPREELEFIEFSHPKYMAQWIEERQGYYND
jgi:hypothetical protein